MKKLTYILLGLFVSMNSFAQEAAEAAAKTGAKETIEVTIAERMGLSETALFTLMMCITIVLLIILAVMISTLKNVLNFKINGGSDKLKMILVLVTLGFTGSLFGQDAAAGAETVVEKPPFIPFSDTAFWMVLLFDGILVGLIYYLAQVTNSFTKEYKSPVSGKKKKWNWNKAINDAVAIEEEYKIEMDHEYDGIRELDNNLPPWWKYSFYISIVWAVFYIGYYHVLGMGDLQIDEYKKEVADAKEKYKVSLDENTVTLLVDEGSLAGGQAIFDAKCAICHRTDLGGDIGPNLTDKYWLYGGDVKDVFRTIKYGATNGMQAWASELSPEKMQKVASYILSKQGSNPASPKEPQGDLYVPEGGDAPAENADAPAVQENVEVDTLTVINDTLNVEDNQ
ncbi:MAG: c-type cytochrome [Crocinitomicaceae bacterium]|nr:c-type cytochrome [Crocinitomicaceae bacterium]